MVQQPVNVVDAATCGLSDDSLHPRFFEVSRLLVRSRPYVTSKPLWSKECYIRL